MMGIGLKDGVYVEPSEAAVLAETVANDGRPCCSRLDGREQQASPGNGRRGRAESFIDSFRAGES